MQRVAHADQHPDLRADFVLANPPFNISEWGGDRVADDVRWVIRSYRSRQAPWPSDEGGSVRILPGWIDHMDGGLLVERITPSSR